MVGVVMPHGVLFRGAAEGEIRKGMLQEDLLEAVVGLPSNLFYGTGIPAAILVLNRKKAVERQGKVLFIDGSRGFVAGPNQNVLREEDVLRIATTFHSFNDLEHYARVVSLNNIEENDYNLNIGRYVEVAEIKDDVDVRLAITRLRDLEKVRTEAEVRMNVLLREIGYLG
jgi:type I restriction enzyme M protein